MEKTLKLSAKIIYAILICLCMTLTGCTKETESITVNKEPESITVNSVELSPNAMTITEGEEVTLTATVHPDNATNKNVAWSSSNTAVATVTDGKVTALKTGNTTITVTTEDGAKTATCEVTVKAKNISTEEDKGDLNYGETGRAGDNIDEENDIYDGGSF